uniref:Protein kinase domain-containing protein n=1 Tax=Populus alba TaxID=43335 RepID=A0A4U5M4W9_POPAL|nr:hypothetical protein D5086_0000322290 [Populus alba]
MPFGLVSAWNKRRRSKSQDHSDPWVYKPMEFWQLEDQTPQSTKRRHGSSVFTLKEMEEATCSFSEKNLVGKGGFGRVYRGVLRSGEVVAIKKMELPTFKEAEGEREFRVEVDILSRLEHPNLVSLIGYCADGKDRFLVYEYLQHGNLQDHLNGQFIAQNTILIPKSLMAYLVICNCILGYGKAKMEWPLRLKVALGSARGLAYLHSSSDVGIPIVHRDFKSTNILLNANFEAKVRHILNDRKKLRKVIDPELSRSSYTLESIAMFANLASRCIRIQSSERPSMAECVKELQTIIYTNSKPMGMGMGMMTFKMV